MFSCAKGDTNHWFHNYDRYGVLALVEHCVLYRLRLGTLLFL